MLETISSSYRVVKSIRNREFTFYAGIAILFVWCFYASFVRRYYYFGPFVPKAFDHFLAQVLCFGILVLVFMGFYWNRMNRVTLSLLGGLAVLIAGTHLNFYDYLSAIQSININAISLLFGMMVVSAVLEETNIFAVICKNAVEKFGTGNFAIFVILCLMTYFVSLFFNSMMAVLLILPMTFNIASSLKLNVVPYVVGEIVASNLGGASTMLGDFPNMLISTQMNIPFHLFIRYVTPVCLINLAVLFFYVGRRIDFEDTRDAQIRMELPEVRIENPGALKWGFGVLAIMIALFTANVLPAGLVALCGGFILMTWCGIPRGRLIEKIRWEDVAFFSLMFILMEGVRASGLVQTIKGALFLFSAGNAFMQCIILMWGACAVTAFLNAGPATMLMLPAFLGIEGPLPDRMIFWALSLGICAGASATLTGATAGPVASSLVEVFNKKERQPAAAQLTFGNYMEYGLPIAFVHLILSTIYITILYLLGG